MRKTARHWLLPGAEPQVCTSLQLRAAGVHRLRCVDIGRSDLTTARRRAQRLLADEPERCRPELVAAHNVRVAMESGNISRFGITREEAELLRAGDVIHVQDALGKFAVGWRPLH